ncbi:hypothetical protein BT96DRAFT_378948 [Gymnopus androsaceus JB14]|uniref:Uncharacterized protein n=1 Tax=Gymnopus androsaceus JB14 TaxID=1447944 RepID=A0A6A4INH6_9AGAR|nr:hypothetical protein BT96DRAFT_378948 [Gymnopus androsaceus JB14]
MRGNANAEERLAASRNLFPTIRISIDDSDSGEREKNQPYVTQICDAGSGLPYFFQSYLGPSLFIYYIIICRPLVVSRQMSMSPAPRIH